MVALGPTVGVAADDATAGDAAVVPRLSTIVIHFQEMVALGIPVGRAAAAATADAAEVEPRRSRGGIIFRDRW